MSKSAKKRLTTASSMEPVSALTPVRHDADAKAKNARSHSKQSRLIAMLQSPTGATIAAMMQVTGWQRHSVRGFLAGVVRNRLKLKLDSKKVDGIRVYQLAGRSRATLSRPERRSA
jgi:Protein of unknown function (DUF3489)